MTSLLQVVRPGAAKLLPPGSDLLLAARRWAGRTRRIAARALPWVVRGIVAVAVVSFAGLAVGPHVLGYRTMTMLTASMAPVIDPGDVTIVTPLAVSDVTEGMVITYHIPIGERQLDHPPGRLGGARHGRQRHRADQGRQQRRGRPLVGHARGRHRLPGPRGRPGDRARDPRAPHPRCRHRTRLRRPGARRRLAAPGHLAPPRKEDRA